MNRPLQHLSTATLWDVVRRNPAGKLPKIAEQALQNELVVRRQQERRK